MHDWIKQLTPGQRVLDLGSGAGSLKSFEHSGFVVYVDCDKDAFNKNYESGSPTGRVLAAGESLPFASGSFDLVLCHHVLEHIGGLAGTLQEISRVLKPGGRLYVAVPNGYGLCDGIYRYVFDGGDHVNRFEKEQLVATIESAIKIRAWQKLYSSFAYLSRLRDLDRHILPELPPRLRRFARLPSGFMLLMQGSLYLVTRLADRVFGVDWALYGWALYFERADSRTLREDRPYVNVCLYCGSGHPAHLLVRRYRLLYICPTCDHTGLYFAPFRNCI